MQNYRILSFNIRINVAVDGLNAWEFRKEKVVQFIKTGDFDIIGFQEVAPDMYQELIDQLKAYHYVGFARSKGSEAVPIFVKKDKYRILESNTFWLSDTPDIESRIEGSFFPRIATYVVLEDQNKQRIAFFNTHLDYASDEICKKQSMILSHFIDDVTNKYQSHFVLAGDFNVLPDSDTIGFLTNKYRIIYEKKDRLGLTFHNYTCDTIGLPIDYFFFSSTLKDELFRIVHHKDKNFYLSDHYPIVAEFSIKK